VARLLRVAALYALVGAASFLLLRGTGWAAPVWPAAGIAFAFVFDAGAALLPGVALGCFLLSLPVYRLAGLPLAAAAAVSLVVAAAVALQAQVGAQLVRRRLGPRPQLERAGEILTFMTLAGPLPCLIAASVGVLTLSAAGLLTPAELDRAWLGWWVGDGIGVIVFAPLALMTLPNQAEVWRGRRLTVAVPSLLLLTLALAAFLYTASLQRRELDQRLNRRADLALEVLRRNLSSHEEALQGIRSVFEATGALTPDQFARFTASSLRRLQGLHAVSWNPLVRGEDLAGFERDQRRLPGFGAFRVTERDASGSPVPARPRPWHVPVALIEPAGPNRAALGFDIRTDPVRAEAIAAALAGGVHRATAPIQLVQEQERQKGMLLLLPVRQPRGFAVGVYRLGDLLSSTFEEGSWEGFRFVLMDRTPGSPPEELARFPPGGEPQDASVWSDPAVVSRTLDEGGRLWQLELHTLPALPGKGGITGSPLLRLGGLLISGLLEGFLLLTTGTERQRQRDLEQKLRTSLTAAAVAHEIKQPLARMLFLARTLQTALRRPGGQPAVGDLAIAAEGIRSDARRVSRTIDSIRDILGNVVSSLALLDIAEPVRGALLVMKADLARHDIDLRTRGLERPRLIEGDRDQLQLVIINLIRNAIEATGPGGKIELIARQDRFGVELEVSDDGPGFPADVRDPESLFLNSSKAEGTGIGLFVVRCAVENHRGSVRLGRSGLGGAAVVLRFPPVPPSRQLRR
jgi:signal transduction histidine kinase